ncbi:hypothetical protein E2I00_010585, partial [Balaenoptera physalus]
PEQEERTLRKNIAREQQLLACLSRSVTFSKQSSKVSSSVKCNPTSGPDGSQVMHLTQRVQFGDSYTVAFLSKALLEYPCIPIRTTLDNSTTVQYAGLLHQLTVKAKSTVRDIDPQNDLTFLRIRSKKHEIMVAPDKEYLLIVIQNPCE